MCADVIIQGAYGSDGSSARNQVDFVQLHFRPRFPATIRYKRTAVIASTETGCSVSNARSGDRLLRGFSHVVRSASTLFMASE